MELVKQDKMDSSTLNEDINVENKVGIELNNFQRKVVYIGGILNPLASIFIISSLQGKVSLLLLSVWSAVLNLVNATNVYVAYRNHNAAFRGSIDLQKANRAYHFMLGLLCLAWGSIALLYISNDAHYELYIITFLELCIVGFSFGNMGDFFAAVVSNICLLIPYISLSMYSKISDALIGRYNFNLHLMYSITLLILSIFSLMVTYVGYRLIIKFFKLTFENMALSEKLENANKFLEKRVKERTLELEDSLKVVSYQATHDLLTDLPNQRLLLEYLNAEVMSVAPIKNMFAVCYFFLNEMEKINEGLGHQASTFIIKTIAHRFKKKFSTHLTTDFKSDYIVTLSREDIFIILIKPVVELKEIDEHIKPIFSVLDIPIYFEKQAIKLTASVGVSLYPRDGNDVKYLLMNAGAAMLHAKKKGGNWLEIYTPEDSADISMQLQLESSLHTALTNNEFRLQYQPVVDLNSGKICSVEALVRWQHPSLGRVAPTKFIPLAEANGIIIPLGEWVFRTACAQTKQWHEQGFSSLIVAVNLSPKQLQKPHIVETFVKILNEINLSPEYVEIELTESEVYQKDAIPILKKFKVAGFRLVIDDFGTGYSGLSNLKLFDVDKLKIDQSFIRDITVNDDSKSIVSNTIDLAKRLNIAVLAEGVETKEQLDFIQKNGCTLIQGYYFSPPVNPEDFATLKVKGGTANTRRGQDLISN